MTVSGTAKLVAGALLVFLSPLLCAGSSLPKALLITGKNETVGDRDPDWRHLFFNDHITDTLEGLVQVTVSEDLAVLNDENLEQYDLILNNSMFRTPTEDQLEAFYRFIGEGKSYLALHMGLATFLNSSQYADLIGGRFLGWEPRQTLDIEPFDAWYGYHYNDQTQHPITRGLASFQLDDELYVIQTNTDELEVIARAQHHPLLWLRDWENGRAMGLALGHGEEEGQNPIYRALLQNSVRWLVGYPILETLPNGYFPVNAERVDKYANLHDISHHAEEAPLTYRVIGNSNPGLISAEIAENQWLSLAVTPNESGQSTLQIAAEGPGGLTTTTEFSVSVREEGSGNLAAYHGVTVHTSSNEFRKFTANPAYVRDADPQTRWSSDYEDPSWIYLDLGKPFSVSRVRLLWEAAHARAYRIQVSTDAERWTDIHAESNGNGGEDLIEFEPTEARYVRLYGDARATEWGYSLYEFEVYSE